MYIWNQCIYYVCVWWMGIRCFCSDRYISVLALFCNLVFHNKVRKLASKVLFIFEHYFIPRVEHLSLHFATWLLPKPHTWAACCYSYKARRGVSSTKFSDNMDRVPGRETTHRYLVHNSNTMTSLENVSLVIWRDPWLLCSSLHSYRFDSWFMIAIFSLDKDIKSQWSKQFSSLLDRVAQTNWYWSFNKSMSKQVKMLNLRKKTCWNLHTFYGTGFSL